MTNTFSLKALYYPFARCINPNTLKRAILLFDEIGFIDPTTPQFRESLIAYDQYNSQSLVKEWNAMREVYGLLLDEGIVHLYDPEQLILDNDTLLANSLKADINDNEFWTLCTASDIPQTWSMLRRKIPPSAFDFLDSQVIPRVNYSARYAKALFRNDYSGWKNLRDQSDAYISNAFDYCKYIFHDGRIAYEIEYQSKVFPSNIEFSCVFPYAHGSSLAISQALIVAHTYGLVPFTDSVLHHRLVNLKYKRALDTSLWLPQNVFMPETQQFHPEKIRRVALTLFDTLVPEDLLERISIAYVVRYRKQSAESFQRLKEYIADLTSQIESDIWDKKYEAEIQKMLYQKIVPESRIARDAAIQIYEDLFGRLTKKAVTALTPTLGASVLAGLNFPEMLLMSSASVLGAIFPDLMEAYLQKKKYQRNSLAYLIDLKPKRKRISCH